MLMERRKLILEISESIDAKDAAGFSGFITENGMFRFGNSEEVMGRKNIGEFVAGFFKMIKSSKHELVNMWDNGNSITWQGVVNYVRLDEKKVSVNFVNILFMEGDMITDYLIYIDNTPLFA